LQSEAKLRRNRSIPRTPGNGAIGAVARDRRLEPRLEFKMPPEPNDALIRAVVDEWIVPAMVDQFLTLNGDIRSLSIRLSDAEHSVFTES
jgi:hypothetical protein